MKRYIRKTKINDNKKIKTGGSKEDESENEMMEGTNKKDKIYKIFMMIREIAKKNNNLEKEI